MLIVEELRGGWVRENEISISKEIRIRNVGMYVLSVEYIKGHSFTHMVEFCGPDVDGAGVTEKERPQRGCLRTVCSDEAYSLDAALREVMIAYRNHRSFIEAEGEFDAEAAARHAQSPEIQDWLGR